jgi:hypothetical protein
VCAAGSCAGGNPYAALEYLERAGSHSEASYPYHSYWSSHTQSCHAGSSVSTANVSDVRAVHGEDDIAAAAATQVSL